MKLKLPELHPVLWPLIIFSLVSVGLFAGRTLLTHGNDFWFLNWNLFLAWLPLLWVWLLMRALEQGRWLGMQGLSLTALWLLFLPNSFYLVSDFVNLRLSDEANLLYDGVMLMSYALSGLALAWVSVWFMHRELLKRLSNRETWFVLTTVFLVCGFAIYLGRFLRWNSWDIMLSPHSILFDVSDRILNPSAYPNTFTTTLLFFVFIAGTYYGFYRLLGAMSRYKQR